jgi:hypothetical protein
LVLKHWHTSVPPDRGVAGPRVDAMTAFETNRLVIDNFRVDDWSDLQEMIVQYQASAYASYDHEWPTSKKEIE